MTKQELENKLHTQIPMTKLMHLNICSIENDKLITTAPLDININDKGTAFGGSLSTITIISSWSIAYLISLKLNLENTNIVIYQNNTKILRPVTKNIICHTYMPTSKEIEELKDKLDKKSSASINISSKIIENDKTCVDFNGIYIIKVIK